MSPLRFNKLMRRQLDDLRREGVLDSSTYGVLLDRYPLERWDWRRLGRWFLIFGAISTAAGAVILGKSLFEFTLEKLAVALALTAAGLFYGGHRLRVGRLLWTRRSLELLGSLTLIGLTFTLGVIYSSGSGNWPMLLLIDLLILLPLSYLLRNALVLVLCMVVFFTWFGGVTGYVSGWGAYWFSMNYPMRFLLAGLAIIGVGLLHRSAEDGPLAGYRDFFKVWLSAGLFFSEMALWLMSLFGNFGRIFDRYLQTVPELLFFNLLWAGFNGLLLWLGSRHGLRMARGYAVTFLIIQGYTLYFWKIAGELGWILGSLVAGGVTLWGVMAVERRRRQGVG